MHSFRFQKESLLFSTTAPTTYYVLKSSVQCIRLIRPRDVRPSHLCQWWSQLCARSSVTLRLRSRQCASSWMRSGLAARRQHKEYMFLRGLLQSPPFSPSSATLQFHSRTIFVPFKFLRGIACCKSVSIFLST